MEDPTCELVDVEPRAITIIGSAGVDVSLSPFKGLKPFGPKSDVDAAILRGYPVLELYMQDTIDSSGNERHRVDGQQRIRACMEFIDGDFELDADESPNFAEMTFDDLSEPDKKKV